MNCIVNKIPVFLLGKIFMSNNGFYVLMLIKLFQISYSNFYSLILSRRYTYDGQIIF